jgi:hypothetical protein
MLTKESAIVITFTLFIFLAFIFADINYFLPRYILYVIPFIVLGGTYTAIVIFEKIFSNLKAFQWVMIIFFCGYGIVLGHKNMYKSPDTCDMSYKLVVNVSQQAIHWAEQNWSKDTIEANFPIGKSLKYHIIKTFDDSYTHIVAVEFERNDSKSTVKE